MYTNSVVSVEFMCADGWVGDGWREEREGDECIAFAHENENDKKKNANEERQRKEFVKMHINVFSDVKKLIVRCIEKWNDAMTILTYVQVSLLDYSIQHLGHNRLTTDFECNSELNFHDDDQQSKKPEEKETFCFSSIKTKEKRKQTSWT